MKLHEMAGVAAGRDIQKATKKTAKQQAAANKVALTDTQRRAEWESQVLEQMAFQSQTLAAIRDLLAAQQASSPETPSAP